MGTAHRPKGKEAVIQSQNHTISSFLSFQSNLSMGLPQHLQEIADTLESSESSSTPEQISSFLSQFEEKTKKLTREERLKVRNDVMLRDRFLGKTTKYIADKFRLTDRRIRKIFEELDADSESWYLELPRKFMASIHRYNSERVFDEIQRLISLRNKTHQVEIEIDATSRIIDSYIKYDKMIAEGPVITRHKELTEKLEGIVDATKQT